MALNKSDMALFPNTHCPSCNGPVTFFEVMSIVTPFQAIDCSTCGELVFLKHKMKLFMISLGLGLIVFVFSLYALMLELMPMFLTYSLGMVVLVLAEFTITAYIIKKKDLVVRRTKQ